MDVEDLAQQFASDNYAGICPEAWAAMDAANHGHATAYGVIMAIPALVMYSVLQNRVNKLSDDMTQSALRVFNLLGFHYDAVRSRKSN